MNGHVAAIYRHPVKGFTPEAIDHADLRPGEGFPHDRIFAVENGPCGFDPDAPVFVPKTKFTVLMGLPKVAAVRTRYHEDTGAMSAQAPGVEPIVADMTGEAGREAFAAWLAEVLGEEVRGPLRVIQAPQSWRFTDHPLGQVSIINLASVADLSQRMGVELDPLRFRANVYVSGWPAWVENDWTGSRLMLGWATAQVFKPIVRCAAIHVNLETAQRDLEITKALFDNYGHMNCGIYVHVTAPGRVSLGDAITAPDVARKPQEEGEWA
ncbi:MOSC domain-containing protein [Phenylobacterium sp.]|jgi:uncharacterized protein YcbX|uniref:MOSC domain-containing protein n=1 Tax=Phenylobacterium sp. TaxID=1871053 RepID=UPI002F95EBA0